MSYAVDVLDPGGDVLVLDEEVVAAGHVLHDVPFDLLVLEHGQAVVDEDGRRRRLEVGAEVGRRLQHVHRRHLEADRLQFGQQVQIHKVLLTEQARALPAAVDRRSLRRTRPTTTTRLVRLVPMLKKNNRQKKENTT